MPVFKASGCTARGIGEPDGRGAGQETFRPIQCKPRGWFRYAPQMSAGALGLAAALMLGALPAFGQTPLERHPVAVAPSHQGPIIINAATYGSDNTTPYGVALSGVTLIGENDAVASTPVKGIVVAAAPEPEGHSGLRSALAAALIPFLGAPLSAHEIAALQAAVAGVYRAFALPFTSVTAPPQEITSGVVQLRVVTFRTGTVAVKAAGRTEVPDAAAIRAAVRLAQGDIVDARQLTEDLDWLNRNPYRHVGAVFSPGSATALTDLSLEVSEAKLWSLTAGWSNTGSSATGLQRYSIGGGLYLPMLGGTTLSYLLTGGDDFFADPGRIVLKDGDYPQYLSQAARIVVPTAARQQIEFTPDLVATRQDLDPYTSVQNLTLELPVTYRTAVSNLLPGHYWGDFYVGLALKGLWRKDYFAGSRVAAGSAALVQTTVGWSNTIADRLGETAIDLSVVANPGATIANSGDAAWSAYSGGRVTSAAYVYGVLNLTRRTALPEILGHDGYSWVSQFTGVLADTALPETEQLALGGTSGSRGYRFSDVAVDRGVIWRNALQLPTLAVPGTLNGSLSPYLFGDVAWGEDLSTKAFDTLISLGVGADMSLTSNLSGGVVAGRAMTDAGSVKAGDWSVQGNVSFKF